MLNDLLTWIKALDFVKPNLLIRIPLDLICYAVYICNSWLVRVHINRRQIIESHENLMGSSRYIGLNIFISEMFTYTTHTKVQQ